MSCGCGWSGFCCRYSWIHCCVVGFISLLLLCGLVRVGLWVLFVCVFWMFVSVVRPWLWLAGCRLLALLGSLWCPSPDTSFYFMWNRCLYCRYSGMHVKHTMCVCHGAWAICSIHDICYTMWFVSCMIATRKVLTLQSFNRMNTLVAAWFFAKVFMEWVYAWVLIDESVGCGGANCSFD